MRDERRSYYKLIDMGVLLWMSSSLLQNARGLLFQDSSTSAPIFQGTFVLWGVSGGCSKVPIQSAKEVLNTREATDWIVDQFIPRGRLILLAGASGSGKARFMGWRKPSLTARTSWVSSQRREARSVSSNPMKAPRTQLTSSRSWASNQSSICSLTGSS